ncbi:MAG: phosphoesterase, partial [Hyphomicrobiales bacterium]|nr:phosphoesterase [Hyphomicrobiales bacterium]
PTWLLGGYAFEEIDVHTSTPQTSGRSAWPPRIEVSWLLSLFVIAALILVFGLIAEEVAEGDTSAFDRRIVLLFRAPLDHSQFLGPAWLPEALRDLTSLGSIIVLSILILIVLGYLAMTRNRLAFVFVLGSVLGGQFISTGLKTLFDRARPDLIPGAPHVFTASFPSGHAMLSAVTYLTLGALLARLDPRRGVKMYLLLVAFTLTILVGISRVALGVHWPTDVLAGWCVGSAWALLCTIVAARVHTRALPEAIESAGTQ